MKLRDAQIDNMLDTEGNELTSVRKFGEVLRSAKLIADGYFNDHKAFSVPMGLYEDAGNLVASIDARFAFDPANTVTSLLIKVHYADSEDVLFQSFTNNLCFPLEAGDYDIDAYFKIISTWAGWPNKCNIPETKIRWLQTNRFKAEDLNEQPGPNDGSVDPGEDDITDNTVPSTEYTVTLVDHRNFASARHGILEDYYNYYPEQAEGDGEEWPPYHSDNFPWLVINYNFDGNTTVKIESNLMSAPFTWTPSALIGGDPEKPRTFGIIGVPLPDDLNLPQFAETDEGRDPADLPSLDMFTITLTKD